MTKSRGRPGDEATLDLLCCIVFMQLTSHLDIFSLTSGKRAVGSIAILETTRAVVKFGCLKTFVLNKLDEPA